MEDGLAAGIRRQFPYLFDGYLTKCSRKGISSIISPANGRGQIPLIVRLVHCDVPRMRDVQIQKSRVLVFAYCIWNCLGQYNNGRK